MDKKLYDDRKDCLKNDFCAREVMETHDNGTRAVTSLYSDREESLAGVFGSPDAPVFDPEKIMEQALLMPRINWNNELPDEPDMPDSVEEEETVVPSSQIRPQVGRVSVDLLESEYAFTQYVKKLIPMAIVGGRLYLFQAPCYRLLSDQEILTEIKAALPRDLRKDISMAFLKRAITQLKTEKDLQIDLEEINYNPYDVIFANGIYNVQTGHMRDGCPMDCYIAANAVKFRPKKGKRSSPMT